MYMSNVYYDGKSYYKLDEQGRRVSASYISPEEMRQRQRLSPQEKQRRLVERSTNGSRTKAKPKVVKVNADRAKVAITVLCTLCIMIGGGLTAAGINAVNDIQENQILYSYSSEFRSNAISNNTHRTQNNKYYYYDYDDINDYMAREGADYSQEAYLAYRNLGEHQMDRLFSEGDGEHKIDSLQEFAESEGYATVDDWAQAEREQLLAEHKIKESQAELKAMTDEIEQSASQNLTDALGDNYGGK